MPILSNSFTVRPLTPAIGVLVEGLDLATPLEAPTVAAIQDALVTHHVVFFRDQRLEPAQFLAFARRLGEPVEYPFVKGIDGYPEIIAVSGDGIPYLVPELVLLFKARHTRAKDQTDFDGVLPLLAADRRTVHGIAPRVEVAGSDFALARDPAARSARLPVSHHAPPRGRAHAGSGAQAGRSGG